MVSAGPQIEVLLSPADLARALRDDVRTGLTAMPKAVPPKWFYDDRGCELFDAITRLPEYYPTETERSILRACAPEIAATSAADTLVELGSGTSDKTRTLLDAMVREGRLERFVPFEVNESTLRAAADAIIQDYPGVQVHGVVGDFERHLAALPRDGRRMIAFLGSTIGNFAPLERRQFLSELAGVMGPGDSLLLGTDLVKDPERLERAYNDPQGVTAEFNLNLLRVLNRELVADFDFDAFEHVAFFDPGAEWIEMHLRSTRGQTVRIAALDLEVPFTAGELMRTEISAKFRRAGVTAELASAGLRLDRWFTDPAGNFAVSLSSLADA
ncbi:L-histidine N(alpha)-methyltransferase [Rhabdothermincola sediminis]|uniref:L-histidine N(alpha)-methyltransferase n=1 Tax=Rhabdothermincola sediminis TaxID=2751370 RepID=UPI003557B967